jgi:hypothetical protein
MEEANVTIVFLVPNQSGGYEAKEYPDYLVNTRAPIKRLLSAILQEFNDLNMSSDEVDLLIQAPESSPLSNVSIPDNSRIIIMPKYIGSLIKKKK